jgi:hypothetical protein
MHTTVAAAAVVKVRKERMHMMYEDKTFLWVVPVAAVLVLVIV